MKIREVMNNNPITVSSDVTVGYALDIFYRFQIKSIPVLYNEEIVGLITRQDIYIKTTNRQEKISDIMSRKPLTISPDEDLVKVIEMIKRTNISEIIFTQYNKIVGILSINYFIKKVQDKKKKI